MSAAKLTLIGMQRFLHNLDDDLFKNLTLPEGIDKDTLTDNILLQGSDFEVMYSDPYFMQDAIGLWSRKWNRTFTKWVEALALEYNPLENYDRIEDWDDSLNKGIKTSSRRDSGNTRTFDNQDQRTLDTENKLTLDTENKRTLDTENKRTLDTENKRTLDTTDELTLDTTEELTHDTTQTAETTVSAYDSSSYEPSQKVVTEMDGTDTTTRTGTETTTHDGTDTLTNTGTDTVTNTGTDTMDNSGTETTTNTGTDTVNYSGTITDEFGEGASGSETENSKTVHSGRIHGNIGVTSSVQLLTEQLQISEWNLYEHITDLFLSEFVIPIYS